MAQHFFQSHPEASHLFGDSAATAPSGSLADDPWERLGTSDDVAGGDPGDFDGGMDGGSFDV